MEITSEEKPMVLIRNAWKSYDSSHFVLRDLSMVIPKGKIYSILGSSGVGKTTVLKCITGCTTVDAGQISVDVSSRLQIGYMPQELGLYMELTVIETFHVFGKVFFMSRKEIQEKVKELTNLLELPDKNCKVANLSGGQQRRVSIAVAMLKNPDLLILDEPTVSLDSLLKKSIWNYLERISRIEGKTVVLTTHYIEEANNSDLVGFINYGKVLKEGNPSEVVASTGCSSLEGVYYQLCHQQITSKIEPEIPKSTQSRTSNYNIRDYSKTRMFALLLKSLYYLRRNFPVLTVFILTPCLLTMLSTEVCKRPKQLPVGFVNFETNCLSSEIFNCSSLLSCRYLDKLKQNDIDLVQFKTMSEAQEAALHNKIWGVVRFNSNFSEGVINRLEYFYAIKPVEVSDEDEARIWLDMSSYPISYMLKRTFYDSFLESIEDWYGDCGWNKKAAHPLIRLEKSINGQIEESLTTTYGPSMTIMMVFSTSCSLALILILSEKELGTFDRCKVAGMTLWELIVSEFLFCLLTMLPAAICQLLILYYYSGPSNAPIYLAFVLINLMTLSGILLGILIALLTNNLAVALLVTVTLMNSFYYLAGVMWPVEGSHWFTRFLNIILPSTLAVGTMIDMANRGSTLTDFKVYSGFIHSFLWIVILLICIVFLVQRNNKR